MRGGITGDLTDVPGIGPSAVKKLADGDDPSEVVTNTFQLIGKVRYRNHFDCVCDEGRVGSEYYLSNPYLISLCLCCCFWNDSF